MYHAIISYSRQDSPFVHQLAKDLKKRDKEVWIDFEGILVGEEWWERIAIAIDSSDNFLFVISPDSIVSKYCLRELAHALKLFSKDHHFKYVPGLVLTV